MPNEPWRKLWQQEAVIYGGCGVATPIMIRVSLHLDGLSQSWALSGTTRNFSRTNDQRVHKWKRSKARHVKLNVDASFHADEGSDATAAVLRDDKGRVIAAQCRYIQVAAANTSGFNRVEAKSDSLNVVNCCQGQNQWWDAAATVFAECIDIATLIGKVIFSHCFRKANSIAHELAKFSFSNKSETIWTNHLVS